METPQPCNPKQRDSFARMLVQAKQKAQEELDLEGGDADRRVEHEVLTKLAEERKATELISKLRRLRKDTEDAEEQLQDLGFECSDGEISLRWDCPKSLRQPLEAAKRSARKEREKSLRKYDLAILGVWAADTADEARNIVEALL